MAALVARATSISGSWGKSAYKIEELLALRGSVSESTVSLEKFGDEAAIKEHVLRPSTSLNFPVSVQSIKPAAPPNRNNDQLSDPQTAKKSSPTPSMKRGKAERLLKTHGSPPGLRVTAGGRIVPSTLPSLTSPFQLNPKSSKGFRGFDSRSNLADQGNNPLQANPSIQLPNPPDYGMYPNMTSSTNGLPMYNPMGSFGGFWSGYGYNFPWNPAFSGQFTNPYGYVLPVPMMQSSHKSQTTSEETNPFVKPTTIPILQHKASLEAQHSKLKKEKQELDKDEIRQSQIAPITEAEKRNIANQRKLLILRLDSLRKDILKLQQKHNEGHQYCNPTTLEPVKHTEKPLQDNGGLIKPSTVSISISPRQATRKSHAIEIKAPTEQRSSLNPESPSYEPVKPASMNDRSNHTGPQTPSPFGIDDAYSTTIIPSKKKSDHQSAHSTTIVSTVSNSSPSTSDFFPTCTAEHSSKRYGNTNVTSTESNDTSITNESSLPANPRDPESLATQPVEFWKGFFDKIMNNEVCDDYGQNPSYRAGYAEALCYYGFEPLSHASYLHDPRHGGVSATPTSGEKHFCAGFCLTVFGILSKVPQEYNMLPDFRIGSGHGLKYRVIPKTLPHSPQNGTPNRAVSGKHHLHMKSTSCLDELAYPTSESPNGQFSTKSSSKVDVSSANMIHEVDRNSIAGIYHPSAKASLEPLDPPASQPPAKANNPAFRSLSDQEHHQDRAHDASPKHELWESPKRSPSKQLKNLARHIRSSVTTEKTSSNTSLFPQIDKRSSVFRDGLRRLCN